MQAQSLANQTTITLDGSFIKAAKLIDLSKDGAYFIGEDETGVRYYAEVRNNKIVEYFCEDGFGSRIPSFIVKDMKISSANARISTADIGTYAWCCHRFHDGWLCHEVPD